LAATILLVRHAVHTQYNQCLSGRTPGVPLSDVGREQAKALAAYLSQDGIAQVQCSPLDRTRETAAAIADAAGLPLATSEALIEIDMGDWTGRAIHSFGDDPVWRAWNEQRATARIPGGESMGEAQARIVEHIQKVASEQDGQTVALVSHSDMIRSAIAWGLGLSLDNLLRFDIDPASVSRMVVGEWGARVLSVNERVQ
jgi:broad specificity phosphatase PhoE